MISRWRVGSIQLLAVCLLCGCASGRDPRLATIDTPKSPPAPQRTELRIADRSIVPAGHRDDGASHEEDPSPESRWAPWLSKLKPAPRLPLPVNPTPPGESAGDDVSSSLNDINL